MKCGNLNFLEPSGPLQVCNGTALPLPFTILRELVQSLAKVTLLLKYSIK
jgi:hypothetical protein